MTTPTRVGLEPGQIDRELLCRAVTFALDSVRAADRAAIRGTDEHGFVGKLVWDQGEWVTETDCGTSCCIAGWIGLARAEHPLTLDLAPRRPSDLAVLHLFGAYTYDWPTGPNGQRVHEGIQELFSGGNTLDGVIVAADRLLAVCGHEPMRMTPEGSFV